MPHTNFSRPNISGQDISRPLPLYSNPYGSQVPLFDMPPPVRHAPASAAVINEHPQQSSGEHASSNIPSGPCAYIWSKGAYVANEGKKWAQDVIEDAKEHPIRALISLSGGVGAVNGALGLTFPAYFGSWVSGEKVVMGTGQVGLAIGLAGYAAYKKMQNQSSENAGHRIYDSAESMV